jgi:hypothetical protein
MSAEDASLVNTGSSYTWIFEVKLQLFDKLSIPLFELVIEWTIEVVRVLVIAPRISNVRQPCFCWNDREGRCIGT